MTEVSFLTTPEDGLLIQSIAERASAKAHEAGLLISVQHFMMDIAAVHCNGTPLKLMSLRDADDFNFVHDVFGIYRHLNRQTGKLEDCFVPRFAARVASDEAETPA